MNEEASAIFEHLPIEAGSETLYIKHLYGAFEAIDEKDDPVRPFSILPFHLLFMLAVQYKVYRLSAFDNDWYLQKLKKCDLWKGNKKVLEENSPLENKDGIILSASSVRNLSLIKEKQLFDFFDVLKVEGDVIKQAKDLVEIRGKYAHANGNIEEDVGSRIDSYLQILDSIQLKFENVNKASQSWNEEIIQNGGNDYKSIDEFFAQRFLKSQFSPRDFGDVIKSLLINCNLDQLRIIADKGIDLSPRKTILALQYIVNSDLEEDKRNESKDILKENGESE